MPNLRNYDFYHVGISGGKDSTALFLWCVYESGLPLEKFIFTFCDTQNEDELTYAYLDMLREHAPIQTITPPLGFYELAKKKRRFPSSKARFCTQQLKVLPSLKFVLTLMEKGRVLVMSGVRKAEGNKNNGRSELDIFGWSDTYGCDQLLPIYEWSLDDVFAIHSRHIPLTVVTTLVDADEMLSPAHKVELVKLIEAKGIPCNPLYYMQASRVGCFPCINSRKLEIRAMAKYRPERIEFIAEQENQVSRVRVGDGKAVSFSSMFARNTVPERHRTVPIITAKGEEMMVASIRDVVGWSQTKHGGRQFQFEFAAFEEEDVLACDLQGHCE